ncbi:MAG: endopeptidase La [Alphaproteobacteria bacterium]|nr:endopeptidase La [Alphaproteobacteria bacterium]
MKNTKQFIVIPLRESVVFPGMITPIFIGRDLSVKAVEKATETGLPLLLLTQKNPRVENVMPADLYKIGSTIEMLQYLKLPTGTVKVLAESTGTARVLSIKEEDGVFFANVQPLEHRANEPIEQLQDTIDLLIETFTQYARVSRRIPSDIIQTISKVTDVGALFDIVLGHLDLSLVRQQKILEYPSTEKRLERFIEILQQRMVTFQLDNRIQKRVKTQMDKNQKDFYLHEKMKAIQKELGDDTSDINTFEEKLRKTSLPKLVSEKAKEEIARLKRMPPMSSEGTVVRNYLEWLFNLPWTKKSHLKNDLEKAQMVLDADHYGLEKIKERILEYLSVQKRTGKPGGTVLCFVGPPGVGKTSLGQSIARAVGREFERISLGGVKDSSEIRGHRRTYIGSQPGRIMAALKKTKTNNPLIMLDEIDKMSSDWHGDPSAALLEVLDPSQNNKFNDHYIELDYDLSDVMFITTANSLDIPGPLLDRMEVIRLSGYTEAEKIEIAKKYLIAQQLKKTGLKSTEIQIEDDALQKIIRNYTQEAGVRSLDREISKVMRKVLRSLETDGTKLVTVNAKNLEDYLGVEKVDFGRKYEEDQIGVVNGLAWTQVGGDLLSIEAVSMPGKGEFLLTGKLGDVMKESIQTAKSFVRSRASQFGITDETFKKRDIHVHLPEGAIPKDGPSAGLGMATAIISILTGTPVSKDVAMTGEITLQGRALPIGGLKEKLLAALCAGVKTVIIPEKNKKDLKELPEKVKKGLKIVPVKNMSEVLEIALTQPIVPLPMRSKSVGATCQA